MSQRTITLHLSLEAREGRSAVVTRATLLAELSIMASDNELADVIDTLLDMARARIVGRLERDAKQAGIPLFGEDGERL